MYLQVHLINYLPGMIMGGRQLAAEVGVGANLGSRQIQWYQDIPESIHYCSLLTYLTLLPRFLFQE